MNDDRLRQLYANVLAGSLLGHEQCPPVDDLRRLVGREGGEADRITTLDHVMTCAECRRDFELLRVVREARDRDPGIRGPRIGSRLLALAASVAVLFGVGFVWQLNRGARTDIPRGGESEFLLVGPAGTLVVGEPVEFTWRAAANAVRYRLEILDTAGALVFDASTVDTTIALDPADVLRVGEDYRWWVRGFTRDGGLVAYEVFDLSVRQD